MYEHKMSRLYGIGFLARKNGRCERAMHVYIDMQGGVSKTQGDLFYSDKQSIFGQGVASIRWKHWPARRYWRRPCLASNGRRIGRPVLFFCPV